jgi:prepilin-type N-terminal cleavage/methylation domain-containing protein
VNKNSNLCTSFFSNHKRRGVSLVEVLIALIVISLGIGGALDLFARQVQGIGKSRSRISQTHFAEGKMTHLRARGYDTLSANLAGKIEASQFASGVREDLQIWWTAYLEDQPDAQPRPRIRIEVHCGNLRTKAEDAATTKTPGAYRKVTGYVVQP